MQVRVRIGRFAATLEWTFVATFVATGVATGAEKHRPGQELLDQGEAMKMTTCAMRGHLSTVDARCGGELLREWARREPVLGEYDSTSAVLEGLGPQKPKAAKDQILLALIRLAQNGYQDEAGACLVAALDPKLRRMSGRIDRSHLRMPATSAAEVYDSLVGALFLEVMAYRTDRWIRSVGATLALNSLRAVTLQDAERRRFGPSWSRFGTTATYEEWVEASGERAWMRGRQLPMFEEYELLQTPGGAAQRTDRRMVPSRELLGESGDPVGDEAISRLMMVSSNPSREMGGVAIVRWAVDHGIVSAADGELLRDVYLSPTCSSEGPAAKRSAAASRAMTVTAVRGRCSKALRAICAAVATAQSAGSAPTSRSGRAVQQYLSGNVAA